MQVVRIYTGDDDESHFEELDLPYEQMETAPNVSSVLETFFWLTT